MNDAEHLAKQMREAASAAGCHIVTAPLEQTDAAYVPRASLSPEELIALVTAVRPPVIYLFESPLDLADEIASALEDAGVDDGDQAAKAVRRAGERLRPHEGEPARVFAEVMSGGVLHISYAGARHRTGTDIR